MGMNVRATEIFVAARKLAQKMEIENLEEAMHGCGNSAIDIEFLIRWCRVKQVMSTQPALNLFRLS